MKYPGTTPISTSFISSGTEPIDEAGSHHIVTLAFTPQHIHLPSTDAVDSHMTFAKRKTATYLKS